MRNPEKIPTRRAKPAAAADATLRVGKKIKTEGKDLIMFSAAMRIGPKGKWQKVELICYGNPFKPPIMVARPGKFRPLAPMGF